MSTQLFSETKDHDELAVQAGDDLLIARAAEAAMARAAQPRPRMSLGARSRFAAAAAVVLSILCASGIAAALWSGVTISWPFALEPRTPSVPVDPGASKPDRKPKAPRSALPTPAVEEQAAIAPVEEPVAPSTVAMTTHKRSSVPDAPELFRDANAARRSGELLRARRLYTTLIAAHESSDEARIARVSLGKLLLAAGEPQAAEREFRRYLASGAGQLTEEALVGQAQSLGSLKRAGEERQAWQRLLAAHPGSVYAAQAKQRLTALDKAALDEASP